MIIIYFLLFCAANQITALHAALHQEPIDSLFRPQLKRSPSIQLSVSESSSKKEYWLLSLDGGGERGILHLATLAELEERTGKRIVDMFDGVAGTSIGGIIAILLTLPDPSDPTQPKYRPKQLLDIFFEKRYQMFQPKWFSFGGLLRTKYKTRGMQDFLFDMAGGNTLKNRWIPTVLVTHALNTSPGLKTFSSIDEDDYLAKDIAMATAAAPTYYRPQYVTPLGKKDSPGYFVSDGGTCMTSPTHAGIAMLKKHYKIKAKQIHVLALGTGISNMPVDNTSLRRGSGLSWASVLIDLLISGQQHADINTASLHLGERYHRFSPFLDPHLISFDSLSDANGNAMLEANQKMLEDRKVEFDAIGEKLKKSALTKEKREVEDSPLIISSPNTALQNFVSWASCWCRSSLNQFSCRNLLLRSFKNIFPLR